MENPSADNGNFKKIIWVVLVVVLIGILIYVFADRWGKIDTSSDNSINNTELTDKEREDILNQLESVDTPELTEAQRDAILSQLESVDTPELTDAQRDAILNQLSQ
ncbi:MAG: hypothetical protein WDZ73_00800 [Candidatus Paceibacterota bacterium]